MYERHFGLTERPFSIAPDPRFLYMSQQHREALAHLLYGVGEGGGFVQLTGEVGTGKTTVCRCLLEQLPDHVDVALILNPTVTAKELLAAICDELRIPYGVEANSIKALTDLLNDHLLQAHAEGRRTVVIIDEAQNLNAEALEEVRLLTNLETTREKLLQIILIGQPELRNLLAREELRQLAQRITARYHLQPIHRAETAAYIRHRLQVCGAAEPVFSEAAIDVIQKCSKGVPRLINVICDRALLGGFVEEKRRVDAEIAQKAAREVLPAEGVDGAGRRPWRWLAGGAAAATVLFGAFLLLPPLGQVTSAQLASRLVNPRLDTTLPAASKDAPPKDALPKDALPKDAPPKEALPKDTAPEVPPEPQIEPRQVADAHPVTALAMVDEQTPKTVLPDLRKTLAAAGPHAAARAWSGLYRLWGEQYSAANDEEGCAHAPAAGLRCLQAGGSWAMLAHFDRPAILLLVAPEGRRVPVLLEEVDDSNVILEVDGQTLTVALRTLEEHWFGEFRLLWKVPPGGSLSLRAGSRGKDVEWLRERLQAVTGLTRPAPDAALFDAQLRELVEVFQRGSGLHVDGVAGPRTFIHLNNRYPESAVPRLGASAASG